MTCNDTTEYSVIYELEHIVAEMTISSRGKSRRVHNEHIAFYNSRETAEAAMRLFIEDEKKRLTEEEYRHYCLGYQLCERKVFNCPNFDEGPCIPWNFYTANGELSQNHMSE